MILKTKLLGHVYDFHTVREVMAKANEEKSGDRLAGIAAENAEERVAAKVVLAKLTLADLRNPPPSPMRTTRSPASSRTGSTRRSMGRSKTGRSPSCGSGSWTRETTAPPSGGSPGASPARWWRRWPSS